MGAQAVQGGSKPSHGKTRHQVGPALSDHSLSPAGHLGCIGRTRLALDIGDAGDVGHLSIGLLPKVGSCKGGAARLRHFDGGSLALEIELRSSQTVELRLTKVW